jgi:fumarylpyruvate hydrolase
MVDYLLPLPPVMSLPVIGREGRFPVGRIFCVGRNYAAHAAEMGNEVDREAPFYFLKSPHAVQQSGTVLAYPPGTEDLHHEIELVVAIGAPGFRLARDRAAGVIWGYGAALDMTRRDLQAKAKAKQRPWDLSKDFEGAAVLSALTPAQDFQPLGQRIQLGVNGVTRQDAVISDMVWSIDELIADLSHYYHLTPGDLILTGTPDGVADSKVGDEIVTEIEGVGRLVNFIGGDELLAQR